MPSSTYANSIRSRHAQHKSGSKKSCCAEAGLVFMLLVMFAGLTLLYMNTVALFRETKQASAKFIDNKAGEEAETWNPEDGHIEPVFPEFIQNFADMVVNTIKLPTFTSSPKAQPDDFGQYVLIKLVTSRKTKRAPKFHMCRVAHGAYSRDPVHLPFFSDLLAISGCNGPQNLKIWTRDQAEYYLRQNRVVPPTGFIFHAGRVGSTLTANMLAVDPTAMVYSEAQPIVEASYTYCRDCDMEERVKLFQLVVGLMGVSDTHERLFFKLHPTSTPEIELFQRAFPEAKYIYLHREPVEVMMSMLKTKRSKHDNNYMPRTRVRGKKRKPPKQPPCLRPLKEVHKMLHFTDNFHSASREEYCGAYLKAINVVAAERTNKDPNGMPVCYTKDFVDTMVNVVLPHHFKMKLTSDHLQRIEEVSGVYSKQRKSKERIGSYKDDIQKKQNDAWPDLKRMSQKWVQSNYMDLLDIENRKTQEYLAQNLEQEIKVS